METVVVFWDSVEAIVLVIVSSWCAVEVMRREIWIGFENDGGA